MEDIKEKYLNFADIANSQIEIEGCIKASPYRPLFKDTWNKHKRLFEEIESLGIYTDDFLYTDSYLAIFYSILYLDYYYNFNKKTDDKKNEKHLYDKKVARLLKNAKELEAYSNQHIKLDLPNYPIDELYSLQNYLNDIYGQKLGSEIINTIKEEFRFREVGISNPKNTQIKETLGAKIAKKNELSKLILSLTLQDETLNNMSEIICKHEELKTTIEKHERKNKK